MKVPRIIKLGCIAPLTIVILLVIMVFLIDFIVPSAARIALPDSASDIQEYYLDSWNGDFIRLIKAKLPQEDYGAYAKALSLTVTFDPAKHHEIRSIIEMGAGDAPTWWNPPIISKTTYFEYVKGDDYVQSLSYSNGYVYYSVTSW